MKLRVLQQRAFAVCKLTPNTPPPAWAFQSSTFYSVTRTDEELSIVCPQDNVPPDVEVSRDWTVLKVQGPLDFSLTGILSSLAQPLAEAEVSIFAVSTFDTDYILVKESQAKHALQVLTQAGHELLTNRPNDGPATSFEADPLIDVLLEKKELDVHNVVLVAGYPPSSTQLLEPYTRFRNAVEACWDAADNQHVYLYPFESLHVTVATFSKTFTDGQDLEAFQRIVKQATEMKEWPSKPLQLVIDSAQIGTRAGILLWKDNSGGMNAMRQCLAAVGSNLDIPDIIHSTFLRFKEVPMTPGPIVQERFSTVLSQLGGMFPDPISIPVAKLINERTPYMHNIPLDSPRHIAATCFMSPSDRYTENVKQAIGKLSTYKSY
jgi:hypothetical protein